MLKTTKLFALTLLTGTALVAGAQAFAADAAADVTPAHQAVETTDAKAAPAKAVKHTKHHKMHHAAAAKTEKAKDATTSK